MEGKRKEVERYGRKGKEIVGKEKKEGNRGSMKERGGIAREWRAKGGNGRLRKEKDRERRK